MGDISTRSTRSNSFLYILTSLVLILTGLFILIAQSVLGHGMFSELITRFDVSVAGILPHSTAVNKVMLFFTYLANPEIIVVIELALLTVLILIHKRLLAAFFLGGLMIGEGLSSFLKIVFARPRPDIFLYNLPRYGYSFPSNHALIAAVFYGFVGYCLVHVLAKRSHKIIATLSTVIIIALISISRIVLGFHFASDVIAGLFIGLAILCVLIMAFIHIHKHFTWGSLQFPHGIKLILIFFLVIAVGFFVFDFYSNHPLEIRNTPGHRA